MSESRTCPHCGAPLPADAPDGLCPKCLLQLGFESQAGPAKEDPAYSPTVYQPRALPPSVEELAAKFPQLEILERIGQGGMGVVYKARQKDLDRIVALKILRPDFESDPAFAERFVREARALAKLSHPAIVTVHDFGRVDGFYYFLMEYIDGANLRELERSGQLQPQQALAIVPQICEALQYAHDQGVVHRDIKPENILLDRQGRVKIADFGLAKMVGAVPEAATLTGAWQVMGTPQYMAPEQMQGSHSVDHRADIYSLGVVIYEMLTGELPVGRFPLPSQRVHVDVRLDEVVLRALEREPERRYQRASEVKSDLETITGIPAEAARRIYGREYRSKATLFGLPLVHIALGLDPMTGRPRTARGIIAIGERAVGGLAIGGAALGGVAFGGLAVGMVTIGGLSLGLLMAVGGMAIGGFAFGGGALGIVAIGGGAVGYYAAGGGAWGGHVLSNEVEDPQALAFFSGWAENWPYWLSGLGIGTPLFGLLLFLAIWLAFSLQGRSSGGRSATAEADAPDSEPDPRNVHAVQGPAGALIAVGVFEWIACWTAVPLMGLLFRERMIPLVGGEEALGFAVAAVALLGAVLSAIVILAGLKMRRLESRGFAMTGSVTAMLVSPGNVIGLPVGLWALYVLTRPEVREAFQAAAAERQQPPERFVRGPAIGLIVYGGLTLLLEGMYLLGTLVQWEEEGIEPVLADLRNLGPLLLAGMVLGVPAAVTAIVAGRRMLHLRRRRWGVIASVLAMIPWGLTFPLGLPIGLWALYVLSRPEVRAAFREERSTPALPRESPSGT